MTPKVKSLKSIEEVIKTLLENRGIKTKKEIEEFLNPDLTNVTPENVGINLKELKKAVQRINTAIKDKEQIVVFGDYDADGLCASAILWETLNSSGAKVLPYIPSREKEGYGISGKASEDHLALVAIATIADLVPLTFANRTLVRFGIDSLRKTKRVGLVELINEAGIELSRIGTYDIGHIIAPRLNATGRIGDALESLRLICTKDNKKASLLAQKIERINKERQDITLEAMLHASEKVKKDNLKDKKLLFIADESYQQGIIGLIAGRLSEEFYRPSIVIS